MAVWRCGGVAADALGVPLLCQVPRGGESGQRRRQGVLRVRARTRPSRTAATVTVTLFAIHIKMQNRRWYNKPLYFKFTVIPPPLEQQLNVNKYSGITVN